MAHISLMAYIQSSYFVNEKKGKKKGNGNE